MGEFINFIEDMVWDFKKNWKIYLMSAAICFVFGMSLGVLFGLIFR